MLWALVFYRTRLNRKHTIIVRELRKESATIQRGTMEQVDSEFISSKPVLSRGTELNHVEST